MKKKLLVSIVLFIIVLNCYVLAEPVIPKVSVELINNTESNLGDVFGYNIKEGIRNSTSMKLSTGLNENRIILRIGSIDIPPNNNMIAYSAVWLLANDKRSLFINDCIGYTGSNVVEQAAQYVIAQTDKIMTEYKTFFKTKKNIFDGIKLPDSASN